MAIRASRAAVERAAVDEPAAPANGDIVLPRQRETAPERGDGKDVRELQALIEQAFRQLDQAADETAGVSPSAPAPTVIGAAAGSELRYKSSLASRLLKTAAGLAIVFLVGIVPLQKVLAPVSNEAFVNAPIYLVHAPVAGVLRSSGQLAVGASVIAGVPLALIQSPDGSGNDAAVVSAGAGKIWEILAQAGDTVAKGDVIARVVGCSAASVTASVSELVYDRLSPGMAARFNFFGSDRFYDGKVANLLGHASPTGNDAISPANFTRDDYRVVISVPDLGTIDGCAVGRRGAVVFNPPTR